MQTKVWEALSKIVAARRPAWKFVVEDDILRILTGQFIVDWKIVNEMIASGSYELIECITNNALGLVICIRNKDTGK